MALDIGGLLDREGVGVVETDGGGFVGACHATVEAFKDSTGQRL